MLGSRLTTIAFPMLVLWLTKSPVYAGIAVFAAIAPSALFHIPVGALVDRWDPRRTMLAAESGRGAAVTFIVLVVRFHRSSVPLIIGLAVIEEILEVFATLAERRVLQTVVELRYVPSASARTEAKTHIAVLAGRPLGGLLFETNPVLPFLADMLTFAFSVGTLFALRKSTPIKSPPPKRNRITEEINAGFQWFIRDKFTRVAMPLSFCMTFICQALIMVFISDVETKNFPSVEIGVVLAASGLGGVLGAAIGSRVRTFGRSRITIQLPIWCLALFVLMVGTRSDHGVYIACYMAIVMLFLACSGAVSNVELDTYIAQFPDKLGRITSISRLMTLAACAIGPAIGGFLIGYWGLYLAVIVLFAITLLIAISAWSVPAIRRLSPESVLADPAELADPQKSTNPMVLCS